MSYKNRGVLGLIEYEWRFAPTENTLSETPTRLRCGIRSHLGSNDRGNPRGKSDRSHFRWADRPGRPGERPRRKPKSDLVRRFCGLYQWCRLLYRPLDRH